MKKTLIRSNRVRWSDYTRGAFVEAIGRWYWRYLDIGGRGIQCVPNFAHMSSPYFGGDRYVRL